MNSTIQSLTSLPPTWCSGCGNWGIGRSLMQSLVDQKLSPDQIAIMFDIGCSGNMADFIHCYGMHTLHGRSVANAVGVKLGNHQLPVVVIGGDGGLYGEGGNHLLHACRGNHDITVIVHDNGVYGLTTGQVSPSARKGHVTKSTPYGVIEQNVHALMLALSQGATFVAQGFAGNVPQLTELITAGMKHRGFSLINVLQPCVSFNKTNDYAYYFKHTYKLEGHDAGNFHYAMDRAKDVMEEKFALGILYQVNKPTYHDQLPQLEKQILVKKPRAKLAQQTITSEFC